MSPDTIRPARTVALAEVAELDRLVFETDSWWEMPAAEQTELRVRLVTQAVRHHLNHCADYERFAGVTGFSIDALADLGELFRVPQLPTQVFKRCELRSVPASLCELFVSSGTSGARSRVWRDDTSLQRLAGSLRPDGDIWGKLYSGVDLDEEGTMLHLGPSRAEAGGVWISYVMTLVEMFTTTRSYIRRGVLELEKAWRDLRTALDVEEFVAVAGPPVFVTALLRYIADRDASIQAGERMVVVTGGGWKQDRDTRLDPAELRSLAVRTLGLHSAEQVRDVFNQVELNTAFVECEHHSKHVPPWVEVVVRDPRDLSPRPHGEIGLLSYLDPSAASYPCFLLSEDFGALQVDRCPCGRYGATVELKRRIDASTHHGCALQLANTTRIG